MERAFYERKIDKLGRVVLPAEIRKELNLSPEDTVRLSEDREQIILVKKSPVCYFCGEKGELIEFSQRFLCKNCLKELKKRSV